MGSPPSVEGEGMYSRMVVDGARALRRPQAGKGELEVASTLLLLLLLLSLLLPCLACLSACVAIQRYASRAPSCTALCHRRPSGDVWDRAPRSEGSAASSIRIRYEARNELTSLEPRRWAEWAIGAAIGARILAPRAPARQAHARSRLLFVLRAALMIAAGAKLGSCLRLAPRSSRTLTR